MSAPWPESASRGKVIRCAPNLDIGRQAPARFVVELSLWSLASVGGVCLAIAAVAYRKQLLLELVTQNLHINWERLNQWPDDKNEIT